MLHTIREFAAEHLATSPQLRDAAQHAHAVHYGALALDLQGTLSLSDRTAVLARLGEELGNLRAAWGHWLERRDIARLDDLLGPLWGYYEARGDYRTAIVLGEELLRALADLPDSPERRHDELVLRANLARTQLAVRGFSTEAEHSIVEALELLESAGEACQRFPALRSLTSLYLWRSDFERGAATARELMEIAEREQDPALLLEAHLMSCVSTSWRNDLPAAIAAADRAADHFAATTSGFVEFRVGANPGVVASAIGGLLRWTAGYPDTAVLGAQRALDLAEELDHPYSRAFALHHASLLDLWRGDVAAVEARSEASRALAEAHGYAVWDALACVLTGAARAAGGEAGTGLAELEEGFARYEELTTPPIFWPALLAIRAAAHGAAGKADRALALVEEARMRLDGDHPHAAEVAIVHGDLLLLAPRHDRAAAKARFQEAAQRSAARGARMLELQALTRLVHVVDSDDEGDAARRLRSVYVTFMEGSTTPPLRAAAEALDGG
jgi:tetratricopeptide (TPR) repeat protein